jgi:outer membrane protein assembly factor BamE (lipoprotein component of BamABCDE complex)
MYRKPRANLFMNVTVGDVSRRTPALTTFCILMLFAIGGCATVGTKIDPKQVSHIQKGVTTRAEVEANLGIPTSISVIPDGGRMALYDYWEAKPTAGSYIPYAGLFVGGTDNRKQQLQIMYDGNNVVKDYEFQDATGKARGFNSHTEWAPTTKPAS